MYNLRSRNETIVREVTAALLGLSGEETRSACPVVSSSGSSPSSFLSAVAQAISGCPVGSELLVVVSGWPALRDFETLTQAISLDRPSYSYHPEHLACVVVRVSASPSAMSFFSDASLLSAGSPDFSPDSLRSTLCSFLKLVPIFNDRNYPSLSKFLRFFFMPDARCSICLTESPHLPPTSGWSPLHQCHTCSSTLCGVCFSAVNRPPPPPPSASGLVPPSSLIAHDDVNTYWSCPLCRNLHVNGNSFGTPFSLIRAAALASPSSETTALNRFIEIISQLDGTTVVIPRIGSHLIIPTSRQSSTPKPLVVATLSGTRRYVRDPRSSSCRVGKLRKTLTDLYSKLTSLEAAEADGLGERNRFLIYTFRKTFVVRAPERTADGIITPSQIVREISLFEVVEGGKKLLQHSKDAWRKEGWWTTEVPLELDFGRRGEGRGEGGGSSGGREATRRGEDMPDYEVNRDLAKYYGSCFQDVQVEYIDPHRVSMPASFLSILAAVRQRFPSKQLTLSVVDSQSPESSPNRLRQRSVSVPSSVCSSPTDIAFDIDPSTGETSLHIDLLAAYLTPRLEARKGGGGKLGFAVLVKIRKVERGDGDAATGGEAKTTESDAMSGYIDVCVYEFDAGSFKRVDSGDACKNTVERSFAEEIVDETIGEYL